MVIVQEADFNEAELVAQLRERTAGKAGSIVTFTGYVRDYASNETTQSLYLDHYPGMCEREIESICATAQTRWNTLGAVVMHRVGELRYKEKIVFIAVACAHRGDAFNACQYIIDALKTRAPFWKRETLASGERFWVQQHKADCVKATQWESD
jgi:molybdopterin synthase catalytic subunit